MKFMHKSSILFLVSTIVIPLSQGVNKNPLSLSTNVKSDKLTSHKISQISKLINPISHSINKQQFGLPTNLMADNLDDLIIKGVKHIKENGDRFKARAGSGIQTYDVNFILSNICNRIPNIRGKAGIRYLSRELLAYLKGSMNVDEGLSQASSFWKTLADENNEICSNYGYYVFHQKVPEYSNRTQYEWVINNLLKNPDSRKALININQPSHKWEKNKDFPCTLALQFFIKQDHLCCSVSSRSTDIFTGLPYDMAFFAFVAELIFKDLKEQLPKEKADKLKLGYVTMKANFTQIYDKTSKSALKLLTKKINPKSIILMPKIANASAVKKDIYNQTFITPVMQWIYKNAQLKTTTQQ
jgi:thymidylate synthase